MGNKNNKVNYAAMTDEKPVVEVEEFMVEEPEKFGVVTADRLNCRTAPGLNCPICDFGPLEKGNKVKIIETLDGWYNVETEYGSCYLMAEYVGVQ